MVKLASLCRQGCRDKGGPSLLLSCSSYLLLVLACSRLWLELNLGG